MWSVTQSLQLLDADTGRLHRQRVVDQPVEAGIEGNGTAAAEVVDDLLVIERVEQGASIRTAYGLRDLAERWRLTYRDLTGVSRFCAGVPCVETPFGLSMLDPATGAVRWKAAGATDVTGRGGHALQVSLDGSQPALQRTVDAATGASRVDLTAWPTFVEGEADTPLVVAAPDDRGGTAFGVLSPGARAVRTLGRTESSVSGCRADARIVACRADGGVEIFEYRP
jgi:hypothetical protein